MDFHAARRIFEASAVGAPPPLPTTVTHTVRSTAVHTTPQKPIPTSPTRYSSHHPPNPAIAREQSPSKPLLPSPSQHSTTTPNPVIRSIPSRSTSRFPPSASHNSSTDYSDVGDYTADTDFYVSGLNDLDASTSLTELPSLPPRSEFNSGSRRFSLVTSARVLSPNPTSMPLDMKPLPGLHQPHIPAIQTSEERRDFTKIQTDHYSIPKLAPTTHGAQVSAHIFPEAHGHLQQPANVDKVSSDVVSSLQHSCAEDHPDTVSAHAMEYKDSPKVVCQSSSEPSHDADNQVGENFSENDSFLDEDYEDLDRDDNFDPITNDGDEEDDDDEGDENEFDEREAGVVRQHSNFSRLSAQSWLTVASAQDVHVADDTSEPATGGKGERDDLGGVLHGDSETGESLLYSRARDTPMLFNRKYSVVNDRNPATLFNVDSRGDVMETLQHKAVSDLSVFECCALLQAGVAVYKKKSFRRYGVRRVWLSPKCDHLYWTSKKNGVAADHVKLQKVVKMKCVEREISIDVIEGYRICLMFANEDEASMWVRALSCLIPLQARVRETRGVIPAEKEREDYNLSDDTFNGMALREYMSVNSYVVLCCAKGQRLFLGNKLAFSKSDGLFCGLRYIPHKVVPLILRSQEEIAVLKRLSHKNIVKYHECLLDTEYGGNYVVFEHLGRGSIIDGSKLDGARAIEEKVARELIGDVINGIEYLHTLRIAHGDIRPDNLLRSVNGSVKINAIGCITHDFTEIHNIGMLVRARLGDGNCAFLAPELCWLCEAAPEAHAKNYAMDVWAIGVVLYFMLYGRVPFSGRTDREIQENICKAKVRFPRQPETSKNVRNLLKALLSEKDPKTRIALTELKTHPWFNDSEEGMGQGNGNGRSAKSTRLIVSPAEVDSAVQVAKVRIPKKRGT